MQQPTRTSAADQPLSPVKADGLRITLDWIEILDSMDVDTYGEFRFVFRVTSDRRGLLSETRYPDAGTVTVSESPSSNRVSRLDVLLYEGVLADGEGLTIEGLGEEVDRLSKDDSLEPYRREFQGDPTSWVGTYGPWDEGTEPGTDPESLAHWRLGYHIEAVAADGVRAAPEQAG